MLSEPLFAGLGIAASAIATMQFLLIWSRPEIARWRGLACAIQATRWRWSWALIIGLLGVAAALGLSNPIDAPLVMSGPVVFGAWLGTLGALSRIDLLVRLLPDRICLTLLLAGIAAALMGVGPTLLESLFGILVGLFFPLAIASQTGNRSIGRGDLLLLAGIGAWLGPLAVLGVLALGAVATLFVWHVGRTLHQGPGADFLPLGPGLCLGALGLSIGAIELGTLGT